MGEKLLENAYLRTRKQGYTERGVIVTVKKYNDLWYFYLNDERNKFIGYEKAEIVEALTKYIKNGSLTILSIEQQATLRLLYA